MTYEIIHTDELYHHGIKGQKWGIRRYQNPDGSLTSEGKARYSTGDLSKIAYKKSRDMISKANEKYSKEYERINNLYEKKINDDSQKAFKLDYFDACDKAAQQNDDLYSGKLDYKDSMWSKLNQIEEDANDYYDEEIHKIQSVFNKEKTDAAKTFADQYFKNNTSLTYKDLEKLYDKKVYNYEHEEWQNDWSIDVMMDAMCSLPGVDIDFDENDGLKLTKSK